MDEQREDAPATGEENTATTSAQHEGEPTPPAPEGEEPTERVDEWGQESFPASDPPENWAGRDRPLG